MKYFSLKEPRDAVWIYAHCPDINHFGLAQSPEVVAGKVYEGEESHFDGAGNQLKSYGVGAFFMERCMFRWIRRRLFGISWLMRGWIFILLR